LITQKLAESDIFSDKVFVLIGNMTNVRYIAAVKIQKQAASTAFPSA